MAATDPATTLSIGDRGAKNGSLLRTDFRRGPTVRSTKRSGAGAIACTCTRPCPRRRARACVSSAKRADAPGLRDPSTARVANLAGRSPCQDVAAMTDESAAGARRLTSGHRRLDGILGGGPLGRRSAMITGPPGTGKTLLRAQQYVFANATRERPASLHLDGFRNPRQAARLRTQPHVLRPERVGQSVFYEDLGWRARRAWSARFRRPARPADG